MVDRMLTKKNERQLREEDWRVIREGLEVKMSPSPAGGKETYILCRSRDRREKEKAMHERFERRIGKIMAKNSRAAGLYDVSVKDVDGRTVISWEEDDAWREWATLNEPPQPIVRLSGPEQQ